MTNGIDVDALKQVMKDVSKDPAKGKVKFQVSTSWKGGTRSDTRVESWELAGNSIEKDFTIPIDEPEELLGENTAPNPQEVLMATSPNRWNVANPITLESELIVE